MLMTPAERQVCCSRPCSRTGQRVSEFTRLRVEDVSLTERVIVVVRGKGSKRREIPIRRELAQMLRLHIGTRRADPLPEP
ncbi:tyrosine-type recombinase/integrase [Mesorhizobium sp.]|uniref:tyrosine-type recombinase/integrase n=1 Tax=Mesorhizobium sp. TaxID=1871066 RepID=UPI0012207057|nr:MAG: hypothetical protein E5X85_33630 [Mesorhizobium sp.]